MSLNFDLFVPPACIPIMQK